MCCYVRWNSSFQFVKCTNLSFAVDTTETLYFSTTTSLKN